MWSQNLVVLYETDVDIAAMLPQPLEATDPIVRVNLAQVDMPMMDEPLQAGTFSVACRHGDTDGFYDLLMIMSTETAVVGGRETFGEPKKIGNVKLVHDGPLNTVGASITGVMSRKGSDLVEVRGTVAEVLDPGPVTERFAFYYKFPPRPAGRRLRPRPHLRAGAPHPGGPDGRAARRRGHPARQRVRSRGRLAGETGGERAVLGEPPDPDRHDRRHGARRVGVALPAPALRQPHRAAAAGGHVTSEARRASSTDAVLHLRPHKE